MKQSLHKLNRLQKIKLRQQLVIKTLMISAGNDNNKLKQQIKKIIIQLSKL